jgi:hypothetical protein
VAVLEDAPAMGRVMVDSFLSAHRGQMPDAAWQQRVDEWTPEVSGTAADDDPSGSIAEIEATNVGRAVELRHGELLRQARRPHRPDSIGGAERRALTPVVLESQQPRTTGCWATHEVRATAPTVGRIVLAARC